MAGAVHVLYGSDDGLTAAGSQLWHQDSAGVPGIVENNDWFGYGLSGGDFDGDGYDDLAVGAPLETVGTTSSAGAVNVIYGSSDGLTGSGTQLWHQDIAGSADTAETQDEFGWTLASGDFDDDGYDELAVGVPYEDVGAVVAVGAVHVFNGSSSGLTGSGNQLWHQNTPGIADIGEQLDRLGIEVTSADFDGDGYDDVATGIAGEQVGASNDAGAVQVIYGSENGLSSDGNQWWQQNNMGLPGGAQESDLFGRALASCDFDGDGFADLAVGVTGETVNSVSGAGAVNVLYGTDSGLSTTGSQAWHQDSPGIVDAAENSDQFGSALGCLSSERFAAFLPLLERAP
jgi:hypothetical protein